MLPLYIVSAVVFIFFIRKYFKGAQFTEHVSAKGKIAVVSGANSGLGLQATRELNLRGACVYMLCRNEDRAVTAKKKLAKLGCDPTRLIVKLVDLADFSTIRKCVSELEKEVSHVDILLNNASILFVPKYKRTVDGHELTWQSNYLGHFLLTELLIPLLKKSKDGRIVHVSAMLHKLAKGNDFSVVNDPKKHGFIMPYVRAKLALIMHARELTRRLRASDPAGTITVNAHHPGASLTIIEHQTFLGKQPLSYIVEALGWLFFKTPKDLAQTALYLCLSRSVESVSGKYFRELKEEQPSHLALDDEACAKLYDASLEAVGLA